MKERQQFHIVWPLEYDHRSRLGRNRVDLGHEPNHIAGAVVAHDDDVGLGPLGYVE